MLNFSKSVFPFLNESKILFFFFSCVTFKLIGVHGEGGKGTMTNAFPTSVSASLSLWRDQKASGK